ncbi:D-alanine aminotransferase [Entamoeba marina]
MLKSNITQMLSTSILQGNQININGEMLQVTSNHLNVLTAPMDDPVVYEVIRIIDGVALFLNDHMDRMRLSLSHIPYDQQNKTPIYTITKWITEFIEHCHIKIGNVRIAVSPTSVLIHQRTHHYPNEEDYRNGVIIGEVNVERDSPNTKSVRKDYQTIVAKAHEQSYFDKKVFEVLLINNEDMYTEGSRSNVFFVNKTTLRTSPDEVVLKGITRKYILEAAENIGLTVIKESLPQREVRDWKAFISGTSLGVLPIFSIGKEELDSANDSIIKKLRNEYESIVKKYIFNNTL